MRRILATLAVAYFFLEPAEARIGETEAQIQLRYGEALSVMSPQPGIGLTKCYRSNPFLVSVTFLNGRSIREMIVRRDQSKMGEAEIQSFLEPSGSESPGVQHMTGPTTIIAGVRQWRSLDQPARVAFYDSQTRALFITTQKFIDLTNGINRQTVVRKGVNLGALGGPRTSLKEFSKNNAVTMRRGQAQPSSSPPAK
jgi:hypothetical protein